MDNFQRDAVDYKGAVELPAMCVCLSVCNLPC